MRQVYVDQVELLLRCLPHVEKQTCFALKGGTAINLFLSDLPRLSVDIGLIYLPIEPREASLQRISDALLATKAGVEQAIPGCRVDVLPARDDLATKLVVHRGDAHVKVEPNTIIRGTVFEPVSMDLCDAAQEQFEMFASALVSSRADLYGGKICAALDRQHPRDLFDVKNLLEGERLEHDFRRAFVVYLASHNRTMHELLAPTRKDIRVAYESSFVGMTDAPPSIEELEAAREELITMVNDQLSDNERHFLLSIKRGDPQWHLLALPHVAELPAIQWKLLNIQRMPKDKHEAALEALERVLGG
jgi:predicted nucleotidyltransferase component of viral defense system